MDDLEVIRFLAMDIITNSGYHAFPRKKSPFFRKPFTYTRPILVWPFALEAACIHNGYSMPKMVQCDVCGGLYNQSHLSSHKRLSHGKRKAAFLSPQSDPETLSAILSLYEQLSEEGKKEVCNRLATTDRTRR